MLMFTSALEPVNMIVEAKSKLIFSLCRLRISTERYIDVLCYTICESFEVRTFH